MPDSKNPWKTLSTKEVYKNPWIRVREDQVIRPDGKQGIYGVVEFSGGVGIVALDDKQRTILVGQWRYTLTRYSWETPTGGKHPTETFLAAAKRELLEETGLRARYWKFLGTVDNSNSATDEVGALFLATTLTQLNAMPDAEEDLAVRWVPFSKAYQMALTGKITDALSVVALLRAKPFVS